MNSYQESYANSIAELGFKEIGHLTDLENVKTKPGKLSLGLECLDRDLWEFDRAFPVIKKLGVKRVRLQSGWQKTEKKKGEYDFAWLDNIVDQLIQAGIDPFIDLCYGNKIYCEDLSKYPSIENGGVGHLPINTEEEREGWKNYVKALATHFSGRIKHFELWNEVDLSIFAKVEMPWPDAYMELVKMTVPVIKDIIPDAFIISCTATVANSAHLVDRGIDKYVDAHSFHGYKFFPEDFPPEALANFVAKLNKKAPSLKFWRGEAGCPSYNDPKSKGALSNIQATEPKQAKFLLRHLTNDLHNDALACSSYFHAYDFVHFSKIVRYHYGLIRHEDVSTKPSYDCFQVLTHIFDGNVRANSESKLSYIIQKPNPDFSNEEYASLKFLSFKKDDYTVYAYFLPKYIDDAVVAKALHLSLPTDVCAADSVILDPLTRKIYPISDSSTALSPVTDYPLFVVNKKMIAEFATIEEQEIAPEVITEIKQGNHE